MGSIMDCGRDDYGDRFKQPSSPTPAAAEGEAGRVMRVPSDFDDDLHRIVMEHCHPVMSMEDVRNLEREILAWRSPVSSETMPSPEGEAERDMSGLDHQLVEHWRKVVSTCDGHDLVANGNTVRRFVAHITALQARVAEVEQTAQDYDRDCIDMRYQRDTAEQRVKELERALEKVKTDLLSTHGVYHDDMYAMKTMGAAINRSIVSITAILSAQSADAGTGEGLEHAVPAPGEAKP